MSEHSFHSLSDITSQSGFWVPEFTDNKWTFNPEAHIIYGDYPLAIYQRTGRMFAEGNFLFVDCGDQLRPFLTCRGRGASIKREKFEDKERDSLLRGSSGGNIWSAISGAKPEEMRDCFHPNAGCKQSSSRPKSQLIREEITHKMPLSINTVSFCSLFFLHGTATKTFFRASSVKVMKNKSTGDREF